MKVSSLLASGGFVAASAQAATDVGGTRSLQDLAFDPSDTAVVIIDPQNDFLSENGNIWHLVEESVREQNTVEHIQALFQAAENEDFNVFISPHYYYPHDKGWHFEGTVELVMHEGGSFDRAGQLNLDGFEGSGADWVDVFKPYIIGKEDRVIVASPHKIYGPEANDLALQLRKRSIDKIILAGMSANLCVESHMRELLEQGFEVYVVKDATAGAKVPGLGDGYAAALSNFKYIANGVLKTSEAVAAMGSDILVTDAPAVAEGDVVPVDGVTAETREGDVRTRRLTDAEEKELATRLLAEAEDKELEFDPADTALVIIDPQVDFLAEHGKIWPLVEESVREQNTIEHITMLFQAAEDNGYPVFISPHYYYPHDKKWDFEGTVEKVMHEGGSFDRAGPLSLEGFEGSGADWLEEFKPFINKEHVIVTNPHKIYGPEANDLTLQLRKRSIDKVILGGMSANLCVESHMRELLEQGFEVYVVKDATAGAKVDELGDGYEAAITNFRYIANGVIATDAAVSAMNEEQTTEDQTTAANDAKDVTVNAAVAALILLASLM